MGAENAPVNHERVAGENASRAEAGSGPEGGAALSFAMPPIVHRTTDNAPEAQVRGGFGGGSGAEAGARPRGRGGLRG
ncbi:hypothetical protein GCM10010214_14120 [Streptomyces abikoensis]|nr:hypothetical protein GCM10010214_14120 [Streptomyces abikoensis]